MPKSKPRAAAGKAPVNDWRKRLGVHPDFPLFPHQAGYWAKKAKGKLHYLGKIVDDPKGLAALDEWERIRTDVLNGRLPQPKSEGMTVGELCDRFLQAKKQLVQSGEMAPKTLADYKRVTDRMVAFFGKGRVVVDLSPDDFANLRAEYSKTNGVVALANFIQRVRIVCKFAWDQSYIPGQIKFGQLFKRPSEKALRIQKAKSAPKLFTADEVRQLIDGAASQLRAMILLGVNAGLGNNDCATLEQRHVDLVGGWLDFYRVKTGTKRRCSLWPETLAALKDVLAKRKQPTDDKHKELVFVTLFGGAWASADTHDSPVAKEFAKLVKKLKLLEQKGRGFYSLRHTFRTVAGGVKDLEAVRSVMGQTNQHVEDAYIEALPEDARLRAVADHVHAWLFRKQVKGDGERPANKCNTTKPRTAKAKPAAHAVGERQFRIVG